MTIEGMGLYKKEYEDNLLGYKTMGEVMHISADSHLALYQINKNIC